MEKNFSFVNVHSIPCTENLQDDVLAKEDSTFTPPTTFTLKYHIEIRHRPSIPDNIQHWQVFENDEQIKKFLEVVGEFSKSHVDQENQNDHIWIMQEGEDPQNFQEKIANHRMFGPKK
jgi:hypothetical protein